MIKIIAMLMVSYLALCGIATLVGAIAFWISEDLRGPERKS